MPQALGVLTVKELLRVKELVKQGLGPTEIQRAMHFRSLNRAVKAIARVKRYPDLEWSCVNANRRKILVPDDPMRRPSFDELVTFLERLLLPDAPTYGPAFTRWLLRLAKLNGLEALAKELVKKNERVRSFAWTPEKEAALHASKAARRLSALGGTDDGAARPVESS